MLKVIELEGPGMSCQHCVATVRGALQALDPNARIEVDLTSDRVTADTSASLEALVSALVSALGDAGYAATTTRL